MKYELAEIFYSIQGEGLRTGEPSVFVRFAGCNVGCRKETHGFTCDTDHDPVMTLDEKGIANSILDLSEECRWVVLTGGEPSMQLDAVLISHLKAMGLLLAVETNGTKALPPGLDWIALSPKPGTVIRQRFAHEVKYVVSAGDPLPRCDVNAHHKLLSPAFDGMSLPRENLDHCVKLCLDNPSWRLSVQAHKTWGVR